MAFIIPDSTVKIYSNIPITNGIQIVFKSKTEQSAYFATKLISSMNNCSYIKKTGRLRIESTTYNIKKGDYISFNNVSFENITYYAEIMDTEYVNNTTTDVLFKIDAFQTFMFDVRYHACSILREHLLESQHDLAVANPWRRDIPELMTDEGLPVGDTLETIYTDGTCDMGVPTGNRFKLLPPSLTGTNREDKYIVFVLSQFDSAEWEPADVTKFLSLWNFYGGNYAFYPTSFPDLFSSWKDGFIRATAIVGINSNKEGDAYDPIKNINEAIRLLTLYNCTSSMVGIYVMPRWSLSGIFSNGTDYTSGFESLIQVPLLSGHDPKLNTFPFRYLRVKTPKDIKEYRFDLFNALSSGSTPGSLEYKIVSNFNGLPTLSFAPKGYKNNGGFNYYERIDFSDFPQAAYSTDAYLTFLSGQYANAMANNTSAGIGQLIANKTSAETTQNFQTLNSTARVVGSALALGTGMASGNPIGMMGTGADLANAAFGASGQYQQNEANVRAAQQAIDTTIEANSARGSGYSAVYDGTKRAFVNDQYHQGSSGGYLPYQFDTLDFRAELVTLEDNILDKYDDYFTCNGYKSLRNGVPHVCKYTQNGAEIPHFSTFDGDTFTYVQTENMKVTGAPQDFCSKIENIFNSGCRFLKVI